MSFDTATPYVAAYVVFRKDDKALFLLRENCGWMDGHYSLAAGKVEKDEPYSLAAVREAKEEVGVDVSPEDLKYLMTIHRKSPDNGMEWVDVFFEATKWTGELTNAEPHMHSKIEWLDINDLPDNTIPMLKFFFDELKAGKTYAEYGWS